MTLPGDGTEYQLLTEAARLTTVPGLICEVGCRLGGGIQAIIDGLQSTRVIVSIDPYGDIAYQYSDSHPLLYNCGYSRSMLVEAMTTIPPVCHAKGHLWLPFIMEDYEFFRRFPDGVPLYEAEKFKCNDYALVHLDGPHRTDFVAAETAFFVPRVPAGGAIAYDNWSYFDNATIEQQLLGAGFGVEARGAEKVVWRRVKT